MSIFIDDSRGFPALQPLGDLLEQNVADAVLGHTVGHEMALTYQCGGESNSALPRRRLVGARSPMAQGPDGTKPSATARNSTPSGQLVGN